MEFEMITLREPLRIKRVCSVHYFEYTKDFGFEGESHDFWEFVYIDKGEAKVRAGDEWKKLSAGEIIFHKPNEFHTIKANGVASNSVIVTFACDSKYMKYFENKTLKVADFERGLLSTVVNEAKSAFSNDLGVVRFEKLCRREDADFGAEQVIKISLEMLLISLYRRDGRNSEKLSGSIKTNNEKETLERVLEYINKKVCEPLTFGDILSYANTSATGLKNMFRKHVGSGVMAYVRKTKIENAKMLIREESYNMTQISEMLGYSEPDKFSRQFKAVSGMTPTEYARSVQAKLS